MGRIDDITSRDALILIVNHTDAPPCFPLRHKTRCSLRRTRWRRASPPASRPAWPRASAPTALRPPPYPPWMQRPRLSTRGATRWSPSSVRRAHRKRIRPTADSVLCGEVTAGCIWSPPPRIGVGPQLQWHWRGVSGEGAGGARRQRRAGE